MSCFHPLKAIKSPSINVKTGKASMIIIPKEKIPLHNPDNLESLPCGKCIGCRLDYSRMWALRCMLEAKDHQDNYFVTLTYAPENIKFNKLVNKETGEVHLVNTLHPNDLKKFIKDLRRYYDYNYKHQGIRFYACGEYGEQYNRPHYHVILFNLPINDLKLHHKNPIGDSVFTSETISKIWDKGHVAIGSVTYQSIAYTARYMTKKHKGRDSDYYEKNGLHPEFCRMSRKPGIGRNYYEYNKDQIYSQDEIIIGTGKGKVLTLKPPRYYDNLYDIEHPDIIATFKYIRKYIATNSFKIKMNSTDIKNEDTFLEMLEKSKQLKAKRLTRPIEK